MRITHTNPESRVGGRMSATLRGGHREMHMHVEWRVTAECARRAHGPVTVRHGWAARQGHLLYCLRIKCTDSVGHWP